jgi:hypothetical protein
MSDRPGMRAAAVGARSGVGTAIAGASSVTRRKRLTALGAVEDTDKTAVFIVPK